jgi:hypothetical protein
VQNMERFFGFRVRVSDFLEPEDYQAVSEALSRLLAREPNADTQYRVYMHQLVLDAAPAKFGIGGGLAGRIAKVFLRFSINPKQRRTGDIKFMNYRFERELHEEVNHYYLPHIIGYSLSPTYFNTERDYFQNTLVTLVRVGMREQHKKIKVRVSVEPTPQMLETLSRAERADAETNLDIDFRKAREFNRQTRLFMSAQDPALSQSEMEAKVRKSIAKTVYNIEKVGTLINESKGAVTTNNTFTDNPALVEHLLQELRLLSRSLQEDPPKGVPLKDVAVVDATVTEVPRDSKALEVLKTSGKWLGTRAEKLGLTLLTEYLKQQAGL